MSTKPFRFKKFTIDQDQCAMKIGTDGVLLPCWVPKDILLSSKNILDIGTGTGIIALILAQRANTINLSIDGIEIDAQAAQQADQNIKKSHWREQIKIVNKTINNFQPNKKYNLIVSNPPYFENALKSKKDNKNLARHIDSLSFEQLIKSSCKLQEENGYLAIIIPYGSSNKIIKIASENSYKVKYHCKVKPTPQKEYKRSLLLFKKTNSDIEESISELIIEDKGRHQYSEDYINLTKDFYLKM